MNSFDFELRGKSAKGVEVPLPKAPLVLAHGAHGFVMCGYLDVQAANKVGVAAAMVRGVSTVSDLLKAVIQSVTKSAEDKGIKPGMTGEEALFLLL